MSNIYLPMNAWQEILARTLGKFQVQKNISPSWLINPATRRHLKLDLYYPDAGIAVRFVGLKAKGQRRQSDWDVQEEQQRNETRAELCRLNSVHLFILEPMDEIDRQLNKFTRVLSRASRVVAQSKALPEQKRTSTEALRLARREAEKLYSLIHKQPEQMMANLAESWRDRENRLLEQLDSSDATESSPKLENIIPPTYRVGERVLHSHFGEGSITAVISSNDDEMVSILFDGQEPKTFLKGLIHDKLSAI